MKPLIAILLFFVTTYSQEINEAFIDGFEQGIRLKDSVELWRDPFQCPPLRPVSGPIGAFKAAYEPAKMMLGSILPQQDDNRKNVEFVITALDIFIESLSSMTSLFTNYPEGEDYCQGVHFGQQGAHMLVKVARALSQIRDILINDNSSQYDEGQSTADIHTSFKEMLSGKRIIGANQ